MHYDNIISNLLKNEKYGLTLSTNDLSYVWGRYVLTNEQEKSIFQYTYHAIKIAHIDFFPKTSPRMLSFHHICDTFISLDLTKGLLIKVGDTIRINWTALELSALFFMFAGICSLRHITWILLIWWHRHQHQINIHAIFPWALMKPVFFEYQQLLLHRPTFENCFILWQCWQVISWISTAQYHFQKPIILKPVWMFRSLSELGNWNFTKWIVALPWKWTLNFHMEWWQTSGQFLKRPWNFDLYYMYYTRAYFFLAIDLGQ